MQRVLVQRGLTSLGFDVGAADGILGARSRAGIRKWQSSRGESATGYLNAGAVATLLKAGEAASPKPQRRVAREAMELRAEALTTARSIEDEGNSRASALRRIAEAQAGAGDTQGALTTARGIEKAFGRAGALSNITKALLDRIDVPFESNGRAEQRAAPTSSQTPVSEKIASEGPWTAYVAGSGQIIGSECFGIAWGHGTETEAVAAARAACIREGGADLIDNCEYTETYKTKCMVVGEAHYTESLTGKGFAVFYSKVGDIESDDISRLRHDSDCGSCPIVANSCAR